MEVRELVINTHIAKTIGLSEMKLSDLDQLVVLVGKNGCGKSRILSVIDWLLRQREQIGNKKFQAYNALYNKRRDFLGYMFELNDNHYSISGAASDVEAIERVIAPINCISLLLDSDEDADKSLNTYCKISDALNLNVNAEKEYQLNLSLGLPRGDHTIDKTLIKNPLFYISDICQRFNNEQKFETISFDTPDSGITEKFSTLKELIIKLSSLVLDIKPGHTEATLNELPISSAKFSDGQMTLLRYAVLIHSGTLENHGVPLLLDEPELNLHPSTLLCLIDTLIKKLPKSQIWIATHSLALAAHLSFSHPRSIWFGEDGKFTRTGRTPEKVINSLLGTPEGAIEIADFCTLPSIFAGVSFAAECLREATTMPYKKADPQISQMRQALPHANNKAISILDFGAGQGRLLEGLIAEYESEKFVALTEFSYYALEVEEKWRSLCLKQVELHYEDANERVFKDVDAAKLKLEKSVDVVIMANVLHEIDPIYWLNIFNGNGIQALVKKGGKLIIVEDTQLPFGELAHSAGFMVLEQPALIRLFGITDINDPNIRLIESSNYATRLQATEIDSCLLDRVTPETIMDAIKKQLEISLVKVKELRSMNSTSNYSSGRIHAYHVQLIANATLALDILRKKSHSS